MKQITTLASGWAIHQRSAQGPLSDDEIRSLNQGDNQTWPDWIRADGPMQVQEILLAAGRIDDPRQYGKTALCKWVAETDWVYRVEFDDQPGPGPRRLVLEGVDTIADVYVNARRVASHDDIYLPLAVDLDEMLGDRNVLLVHFHSPHRWLERLKIPDHLAGQVDANRFLRKPLEDFNNFNGAQPYYTPVGLYAPVRLVSPDRAELAELDLTTGLTEDLRRATVDVRTRVEPATGALRLDLSLLDGDGEVVAAETIEAAGGEATCQLTINQPDLWWPRGYGDQPLYTVQAELRDGQDVLDRASKRIGFRRVEHRRTLDFTVNHKRVKLWGANLTPLEGLSHRWDSDRLETVLDLAENANCVTLRAWGPGAPWNQELYDEADRRGILIWAELFHTFGPYPDTPDFREKCRREAQHHVATLKHHPSILLWCGGNETYLGCALDRSDGRVIGEVLFEEDYREICTRLDPDRLYWANCPQGGLHPNDPAQGDSHSYTHEYWVSGEAYPVFFTEHTRGSTPLVKSLRRFVGDENLWPEGYLALVRSRDDAPMPEAWMKLTLGNTFAFGRPYRMGDFYDTVDSPEGLVYRFGASHSLYIRRCVERYRRGRPSDDPDGPRRTMGHYYWKLNSTWPMIYCDLIDHLLEENMAYYALRRAHEPILLSFDIGDHIHLWLVNDSPEAATGTVIFRMRSPDGVDVLSEIQREVDVPAGDSAIVMSLDELGMFKRANILCASFHDRQGNEKAHTLDFATIERHLDFPPARLTLAQQGPDEIAVTTDRFARCVELTGDADGDAFGWHFQDNFFDLLPGRTHRVKVRGRHSRGRIGARAFFSPHTAEMDFDNRKGARE